MRNATSLTAPVSNTRNKEYHHLYHAVRTESRRREYQGGESTTCRRASQPAGSGLRKDSAVAGRDSRVFDGEAVRVSNQPAVTMIVRRPPLHWAAGTV
jgi:hypothetical protein